jgi:hypothetical protein
MLMPMRRHGLPDTDVSDNREAGRGVSMTAILIHMTSEIVSAYGDADNQN